MASSTRTLEVRAYGAAISPGTDGEPPLPVAAAAATMAVTTLLYGETSPVRSRTARTR
jgi:hypothetical protein